MTEDQFLALGAETAKSHALGQNDAEKQRLFALYKERRGIDLSTFEAAKGADSYLVAMGWILILVGVCVAFVAFTFDVGVSTASGGLYGVPTEVANNDAMAVRDMIMISAAAIFVSGWVALGTGHIVNTIAAAAGKRV